MSALTLLPFYTENGVCRLSEANLLSIRSATIDDLALLHAMIRELADFEGEAGAVTIREEDLARDGFGDNPKFRALIAEWNGEAAGYAVFFEYYSTWAGRALFLEDLFVREAFRRRGVGTALLSAVARIALAENCYGIHWEVLDWNETAINLYKSMGAVFRDSWRPVLLMDEALRRVAERSC